MASRADWRTSRATRWPLPRPVQARGGLLRGMTATGNRLTRACQCAARRRRSNFTPLQSTPLGAPNNLQVAISLSFSVRLGEIR